MKYFYYFKQVKKLKNLLNKNGLQKIVLSRIKKKIFE